MSVDAAVLIRRERCLAKFQERVLPGKALPSFADHPRGIDSAGRTGLAAARSILNGEPCAIGVVAIHRTRYPQAWGQRNLFHSIRVVLADARASTRGRRSGRGCLAIRRAVGRTARVIDYVRARVLVSGRVGFHHVPAEQRKYLVEASIAVQVSIVEVRETAIAETNVCRY